VRTRVLHKNVISTCRRRKVRFSVTTRIDAKIRAACDSIPDDQWLDIQYPQAVFDEDTGRWISERRSPKPHTPRSPAPGIR